MNLLKRYKNSTQSQKYLLLREEGKRIHQLLVELAIKNQNKIQKIPKNQQMDIKQYTNG